MSIVGWEPRISCVRAEMIPLDHRDRGNRADPYTEPNSCFSDSSDSLNLLNSLNSMNLLNSMKAPLHLEKTPLAEKRSFGRWNWACSIHLNNKSTFYEEISLISTETFLYNILVHIWSEVILFRQISKTHSETETGTLVIISMSGLFAQCFFVDGIPDLRLVCLHNTTLTLLPAVTSPFLPNFLHRELTQEEYLFL